MSITTETPLQAAELSGGWNVCSCFSHQATALQYGCLYLTSQVDERTLFTTQLLDTLIPAISQQVINSAKAVTSLNSLTNSLLPLSRQVQAVLLDRGIRVRCTVLWKYIEEWVIPGLEDFFMQAIHLLEGIEVGKASTAPASLLDAAQLIRIQCSQVMRHTTLLDFVWMEYKATAQYFLANPVPPVHQSRKSYVGSFMVAVFQQAPVCSSQEDYHAIATLVEQSQEHVAALYSIFKNSRHFFEDLLVYFRSDGLAAASSNLDVWRLRDRWSLLLQELVRAKKTLQYSRINVAKLDPPLQYHA